MYLTTFIFPELVQLHQQIIRSNIQIFSLVHLVIIGNYLIFEEVMFDISIIVQTW